MDNVATASNGCSGIGNAREHCDKVERSDVMGGSGEEDYVVIVYREVERTVDVGSANVDEVEETGVERRESSIWF